MQQTIQAIKQQEMQASVALNPHTSVNNLKDIIGDVDQILRMSVNSGFGGQIVIENTFRKLDTTRNLIGKTGSKAHIEIDVGVNLVNAPKLFALGANILVTGSSIFKTDNLMKTFSGFKAI